MCLGKALADDVVRRHPAKRCASLGETLSLLSRVHALVVALHLVALVYLLRHHQAGGEVVMAALADALRDNAAEEVRVLQLAHCYALPGYASLPPRPGLRLFQPLCVQGSAHYCTFAWKHVMMHELQS